MVSHNETRLKHAKKCIKSAKYDMASEMASCARMECLWTIRGCGCGDDVLIVKPHHRPVFGGPLSNVFTVSLMMNCQDYPR